LPGSDAALHIRSDLHGGPRHQVTGMWWTP
jgi:hypothetical protein